MAAFVRPPHPFFKFTVVQIGIGNLGNIPLVLLSALCRDKFNPFGDSNACSTSGTAYISFGQLIGAVIMYTYVFHMLAPPSESGSFVAEDDKFSLPIKTHPKKCTSSLQLMKQIFQQPIVASILAMVPGTVPVLKRLIFTSGGPLFFFTDGCIILGQAMIPCILLALGGSLVDGPASLRLGVRTIVAIVFARLLLVPLVGLGFVTLADKFGFLPDGDKMF